jgi:hypothetical protein
VAVVGTLDLAVALGWDHDLGACFGNPVMEMVGIIALIGDRGAGFEAVDELVREGDVVAVSGRADQADWITQRITGSMDLGAQPTARPAQTLGIRPPFALGAPAAC